MTQRLPRILLAATICLFFGSAAIQPVRAQSAAVSIQNFAFQPMSVTVPVGATVTWTNHDAYAHTATSDSGSWGSPALGTGGSYSFTFTQAGTYAYHCAIHSYMTGSIVVQGAGGNPPTVTPIVVPTLPPTLPPTTTASPRPTATATATAPPTPIPSPTATATTTATASPTPTSLPTATSVVATHTLEVTVQGRLRLGRSGNLRVTAQDRQTGEAVVAALVALDGRSVGIGKLQRRTDGKGHAAFTRLLPRHTGSVGLRVTRSGYAARSMKVKVGK